METKTQKQMSERKTKIIDGYKSFTDRKEREIRALNDEARQLSEIAGTGELWKELYSGRLGEIEKQISLKRQDYELAQKRIVRLHSRRAYGFDLDTTDEENRRAIEAEGVDCGDHVIPKWWSRLYQDELGEKLLDIATETQDNIINKKDESYKYNPVVGTVVSSPHFEIERNVWNYIGMMIERNMDEQEYNGLVKLAPKKLLKHLKKIKGRKI